ncbi:MAG: glycosyltransferase [Acutalibacteraceae bacterium]
MSDEKPIISIIIPIYNVGEYLYRCLSSVACQTFKEYEVIMINDGSTDDSPKIAEGFAKNFPNFKLVHNTDKGVSSARNLGISLATGEYIAFVDSDDYIDPNYLLRLYRAAYKNNADVVHCNYIMYNIESGFLYSVRFRKPRKGVLSNKKMVRKTVTDFTMRSYLWNKLWRKSLFTDHNISFPKMKFEDIATVSKLLYYANKGVVLNKYLYYYTVRDGSIVQTVSLKNISDYLLSLGMLRRFFADEQQLSYLKFPFFWLSMSMFFASCANLFRVHYDSRNFSGYFANVNICRKIVSYFFQKEFKDNKGAEVTLPFEFIQPEDRKLKE